MNSEADIEKNGTLASPATARASSVLPVPGGPDNSTPPGNLRTKPPVPIGITQEIDDFHDLVFDLIDARDILERRARTRLRLVELGAGPANTAKTTQPTGRRGAPPKKPHHQTQKQQRRTEPQQHLLPHRWPLIWRIGVDHHTVRLQLLE
jgi:hypothetical protein